MANREKRSVSMPPELTQAIEHAGVEGGTTFSVWHAQTAAHRLRLKAGQRGIADWEQGEGALTADELSDGLARARSLLGRAAAPAVYLDSDATTSAAAVRSSPPI